MYKKKGRELAAIKPRECLTLFPSREKGTGPDTNPTSPLGALIWIVFLPPVRKRKKN